MNTVARVFGPVTFSVSPSSVLRINTVEPCWSTFHISVHCRMFAVNGAKLFARIDIQWLCPVTLWQAQKLVLCLFGLRMKWLAFCFNHYWFLTTLHLLYTSPSPHDVWFLNVYLKDYVLVHLCVFPVHVMKAYWGVEA